MRIFWASLYDLLLLTINETKVVHRWTGRKG